MEPYLGCRGKSLLIWITVCCTSAMALFGYDQAVFSGIIVTKEFLETMGNPDANLQGTITSLYTVGCFFGAVSGSAFGSYLAYVPHMIVGRLVTGLGNGLNTATTPVYQSETTEPKWRGKLVVLGLVVNVAGFSLANWVTFGLSYVDGSVNWRFPLALKLVFGIVILSTAPWLPESPRWLISKGRVDEADFVLSHIKGGDSTPTSPTVIAERNEILQAYKAEMENNVSWGMLLRGHAKGPGTLRRFLLGLGTQIIVQLSGVNATSYYLPTVLSQSVGLGEKLSRLLTAVNSVHYIFFSYLGMMLIDKWGRRGAMLIGTSGCSVCYFLLMLLIRFNQYTDDASRSYIYGAASVAMIFLFYAFFGVGWQGTAWLYNTEINSLHMRMTGASASVAAQWAINYMVVQVTPIGIQNLQWRFYLIWVFFNVFSIPIIYFLYPETANRKLEDIDIVFKEGLRFWVFRDKEATQVKRPARFVAMDEQGVEDVRAAVKGDLGAQVEQIE
ncbi:hypothetical protein BJX65DRAFT_300766 [Aspergillus insuetus]